MNLLPAQLVKDLPRLGAQDVADMWVYTKFFTPDGSATWYVCEGRVQGDDWTLYGWVDLGNGQDPDVDTFSLNELLAVRDHLGLPVERDLQFVPCPLSMVAPCVDQLPELFGDPPNPDDHIRADLRDAVLRLRDDGRGPTISLQTIEDSDIVRLVDASDPAAPPVPISDWMGTDDAIAFIKEWINEPSDAHVAETEDFGLTILRDVLGLTEEEIAALDKIQLPPEE